MTVGSSHTLQEFEEKSDILVPRPVAGVSLLISLRYTLRAPHSTPRCLGLAAGIQPLPAVCVALSAGGGTHLSMPAESVAPVQAAPMTEGIATGLVVSVAPASAGHAVPAPLRRSSRQFQPGVQQSGVRRASACCVCGTSSSRAHSASTSCGGIAMQKPEMLRRRSSFNCCCELQSLCSVWGDCIACAPASLRQLQQNASQPCTQCQHQWRSTSCWCLLCLWRQYQPWTRCRRRWCGAPQ